MDSRNLWYDRAWPVLAGIVTGAGVAMAFQSLGLLAVAAAFLLVELTVAPTAWSIITEMGKPGAPAILEIGPACALTTVVTMGFVTELGGWGFAVVVLALLTSPLLRGRLRRALAGRLGLESPEHDETRRAFDDIVAYGYRTPPAQGTGPERY